MCTFPEVYNGGRRIEISGYDRRAEIYNVAGFADNVANSVGEDCSDWTVDSSKEDATNMCMTCSHTTTISCSVGGSGAVGVWCCS